MDIIERGAQAEGVLNSPAFIHAYEALEAVIIQQWASPSLTQENRESLWHKLQALRSVKAELALYVNSGKSKVAQAEAQRAQRDA
jgi:hypothetical protein